MFVSEVAGGLADLRVRNPDQYREAGMALLQADAGGRRDPTVLQQAKGLLHSFIKERVRQRRAGFVALTFRQFVCWMVYREGYDKAECPKLWAAALANPRVWKGQEGTAQVVAVKKPTEFDDVQSVGERLTIASDGDQAWGQIANSCAFATTEDDGTAITADELWSAMATASSVGDAEPVTNLRPTQVDSIIVPGAEADKGIQSAARIRLRAKTSVPAEVAPLQVAASSGVVPCPATPPVQVAASSGDSLAEHVAGAKKRRRAAKAAARDTDASTGNVDDAPPPTDVPPRPKAGTSSSTGKEEQADAEEECEAAKAASKKNERRRKQAAFGKPTALALRSRPQDEAGTFVAYKKQLRTGVKSTLDHFQVEHNPNEKLQVVMC
jgi:hypothetical protein